MVTVPWPCIGDTSGESWIPNAESSKTVGNEGFLRLRWNNLQWSLTTANCLSRSAHSFPKTFKNSGKTSKSSISLGKEVSVRHPVRRGGRAWKDAHPRGNVENPWENEGFKLNFSRQHGIPFRGSNGFLKRKRFLRFR